MTSGKHKIGSGEDYVTLDSFQFNVVNTHIPFWKRILASLKGLFRKEVVAVDIPKLIKKEKE